jgi:hypothetical protein
MLVDIEKTIELIYEHKNKGSQSKFINLYNMLVKTKREVASDRVLHMYHRISYKVRQVLIPRERSEQLFCPNTESHFIHLNGWRPIKY